MHEENRTTEYEDIVKNMTPYPKKSLLQLSWGVFLWPVVTSYFPEMQFWTPKNILQPQIVTSHLELFLDLITPGSETN